MPPTGRFDARVSGLVMDLRQGESIAIGPNIKIVFLSKSGRITRVRIAAPFDIKIRRGSDDGQEGLHGAAQGSAD